MSQFVEEWCKFSIKSLYKLLLMNGMYSFISYLNNYILDNNIEKLLTPIIGILENGKYYII